MTLYVGTTPEPGALKFDAPFFTFEGNPLDKIGLEFAFSKIVNASTSHCNAAIRFAEDVLALENAPTDKDIRAVLFRIVAMK